MFIVVLFTIAKQWKQPRCPPAEEWIKKMWHIYAQNGVLMSHKEQEHGVCRKIDGTGDHFKQNET
jgi:hypothetical protein